MAAILRFPVRQTGDWSDSERARLDELAARFADQAGVEVAFGRSDSGDPWCVVLDSHDEVLVHVARVQGDVVVHAAAPDVLVRAPDLRTAVDRVMGSRWLEERADVVVPFAGGNRAMQVVTAVLIVGSFVEHHRADAEPASDWIFAPTRPPKSLARDGQRDDAAKVALAADAAPTVEPAADLVAPTSQAGEVGQPFGTSFDRPVLSSEIDAEPGGELAAWLIAGSVANAEPTADIIIGTAGDDELDAGRAPPGRHDLLDGGGGDDRLILDGGTIAIGGGGSDRFLLRAPEAPATGELALLGIVVDFETGVDVLTAPVAPTFTIVATAPTRNIFADPNVNLGPLPELPGQQLFADLDGDGRADGYVLVNSVEPSPALLDAVRQAVVPVTAPPAPIVAPPAEPAPAPPPPPPIDFAAERIAEPAVKKTPAEPAVMPQPPADLDPKPGGQPALAAPPAESAVERMAELAVSAPNVEPAREPAAPEAEPDPAAERPAEPAEAEVDGVREPTAEPAALEVSDETAGELSLLGIVAESAEERTLLGVVAESAEEPTLVGVVAEPVEEPVVLVSIFDSSVERVEEPTVLVSIFDSSVEPITGPMIEVI